MKYIMIALPEEYYTVKTDIISIENIFNKIIISEMLYIHIFVKTFIL